MNEEVAEMIANALHRSLVATRESTSGIGTHYVNVTDSLLEIASAIRRVAEAIETFPAPER